ncbi:hypothetical protein DLJ54_01175 [Corynebacterium heidelbergense]|uniref:Uncharacterized protein n=1 Tax=Corynebacterium heidelbergense TaxID=2055947 RepID=A0A364V8F1_9CORY|nr:hypothetical protein DLJ54_01175 [Corynebacterium heidelbergense]
MFDKMWGPIAPKIPMWHKIFSASLVAMLVGEVEGAGSTEHPQYIMAYINDFGRPQLGSSSPYVDSAVCTYIGLPPNQSVPESARDQDMLYLHGFLHNVHSSYGSVLGLRDGIAPLATLDVGSLGGKAKRVP